MAQRQSLFSQKSSIRDVWQGPKHTLAYLATNYMCKGNKKNGLQKQPHTGGLTFPRCVLQVEFFFSNVEGL